MRRLSAVTLVVAVAAAALAAWGTAAPATTTAPAAVSVRAPKAPPLPAEVKSRKRWVIGVKCDSPPFGYIDVRGRNAGYDVEVARQFAELAFGKSNRITLVCVTTPSRIPALQTKRVDIIVSTLTYTFERAEAIDYSTPYYGATGRLLVKSDSNIASLSDLSGKTVVTTRGALYATWVRNCFPNTRLLEVDSPTSAVLTLKDGRADTFMYDDTFLLGVVTGDREVKLTKDKFLDVPWGIGIRKGEAGMAAWVNWALGRLKAKNLFTQFLRNNAPARLLPEFMDSLPTPTRTLRYPTPATHPLNKCP
jgi:polar amino acid transport system substrate-binding protein